MEWEMRKGVVLVYPQCVQEFAVEASSRQTDLEPLVRPATSRLGFLFGKVW
jgi:hypothetical protein